LEFWGSTGIWDTSGQLDLSMGTPPSVISCLGWLSEVLLIALIFTGLLTLSPLHRNALLASLGFTFLNSFWLTAGLSTRHCHVHFVHSVVPDFFLAALAVVKGCVQGVGDVFTMVKHPNLAVGVLPEWRLRNPHLFAHFLLHFFTFWLLLQLNDCDRVGLTGPLDESLTPNLVVPQILGCLLRGALSVPHKAALFIVNLLANLLAPGLTFALGPVPAHLLLAIVPYSWLIALNVQTLFGRVFNVTKRVVWV